MVKKLIDSNMKKIITGIFIVIATCYSIMAGAQKQEAEILADQFWQFIKDDSSSFTIKKAIGHSKIDEQNLSELLISSKVQNGKPFNVARKGFKTSSSTGGLMGKGQYVCFMYRNKYKDDKESVHLVFEKLVFYRSTKKEALKLILYNWSSKGVDISCD
ncbi:MAG: hypothetical protein IPN82_06170 [Chitinophagaceae bacterium]|nr:hypothetical protein [Chitinophagaceae bacterium]HQX95989.1 hypothetical protein [Chitinophagaceae bacterium]HQZ50200.1 hypothetical protein [Chitinophagaceae bacterium]